MDKFITVYHDAGEREIRAVVLYVVSTKLCADAVGKTQVSREDALDLCRKGFLRIFDTDTFYAVNSFKDASGTLTIGYGASKSVSVTDPSI